MHVGFWKTWVEHHTDCGLMLGNFFTLIASVSKSIKWECFTGFLQGLCAKGLPDA